MAEKSIDELKTEYTDKYVRADATVQELARFDGMVGRVVTVNENRAALVDFKDGPWYDIEPRHLTIVPKPEPPKKEVAKKPAPKATPKKKPAAK